jgi:hypothetical protein
LSVVKKAKLENELFWLDGGFGTPTIMKMSTDVVCVTMSLKNPMNEWKTHVQIMSTQVTLKKDGESSMIALKQMPDEKCEKSSNGEVQFSL